MLTLYLPAEKYRLAVRRLEHSVDKWIEGRIGHLVAAGLAVGLLLSALFPSPADTAAVAEPAMTQISFWTLHDAALLDLASFSTNTTVPCAATDCGNAAPASARASAPTAD